MSASAPDLSLPHHNPDLKATSPSPPTTMAAGTTTPPPLRSQLAAVLAETTQEVETLRSRCSELERRANHFEAMYKSLKDGSLDDTVKMLERRVHDAEVRRDEEIGKRTRMGNLWVQFRDQLRMLESQASEARLNMDRAMDSPSLATYPPSSSRTRQRDDEKDEYPPSKRFRPTHYQPAIRIDPPPTHQYPRSRSRSSSNASSKSIDDLIMQVSTGPGSAYPPQLSEPTSSQPRGKHTANHRPSLSPPTPRHPVPSPPYYPHPSAPVAPNQYPPYGGPLSNPGPARAMKPYGHWDTPPNRSNSGPPPLANHRSPHWPPLDDSHHNPQTHVFVPGNSTPKRSHVEPPPPTSVPDSSNFYPAVNASGQRICRQCGQPGRYKDGKCVEKWGPGPMGSGTVCDRCRKKMKRVERRSTMESLQQQGKSMQPQMTPSQAQTLALSQTGQGDMRVEPYGPPSGQRHPHASPPSSTSHPHIQPYASHPSNPHTSSPHEHRGRDKVDMRSVARGHDPTSRPGRIDNDMNEAEELESGKGSEPDAEREARVASEPEIDQDSEHERPAEEDRVVKSPSSDPYGESYSFSRTKSNVRTRSPSGYGDGTSRHQSRYVDGSDGRGRHYSRSPGHPEEEISRERQQDREREGDIRYRYKSPSPSPRDDKVQGNGDVTRREVPDGDGDGIEKELRMAVEAAEAKSSGTSDAGHGD